ncbi:Uncharacterised protein [Mycobacteroides abscessus subsp. abscessus]|nr:Uncharacterised protein [Mycobacteroides abscessus subsp. abscessus]
MSTRCAPLTITSNGESSAINSRLLAMASIAQPIAAAASFAECVESGS